MNRVEKIKKKLKKSIDEMPVERLAVFLAVSSDVDSKMAQTGLEDFKKFESEIIKAKGNAGIDELDASGHYVDVFTKWLAKNRAKKSSKKIAKKTSKKVAKETTKEAAKLTAKVATKVGTTAAGTAGGPMGMVIGYAVGEAAGEMVDIKFHQAERRMRMLKFFKDKLNAQDDQKDNAYTDYQRQYESWKNACRKPDTPTHKDEKLSDKLARLQREALKTRTVLADRQRTEGQDNMPFAVYSFDRIILFKEGRIVGQGTVEELLHTDSYFMDLYNVNVK